MSAVEVAALQNALATEHAVVWGYGAVGAAVSAALRPAAAAGQAVHRERRDSLEALVRLAGAVPQPAAAAYELPGPVSDEVTAATLAARLEDGSAAGWHFVLGQTVEPALRRTARDALIDAAARAAAWRQAAGATPSTVALPGR